MIVSLRVCLWYEGLLRSNNPLTIGSDIQKQIRPFFRYPIGRQNTAIRTCDRTWVLVHSRRFSLGPDELVDRGAALQDSRSASLTNTQMPQYVVYKLFDHVPVCPAQ